MKTAWSLHYLSDTCVLKNATLALISAIYVSVMPQLESVVNDAVLSCLAASTRLVFTINITNLGYDPESNIHRWYCQSPVTPISLPRLPQATRIHVSAHIPQATRYSTTDIGASTLSYNKLSWVPCLPNADSY